MKRLAIGAASMTLGLLSFVGCRDWDRFAPATGGGDPAGGSNAGAGNVGGDLGGGAQGAGDQGGGPAGGGPTGGAEPTGCGQIDILSDDFDDDLDWRWTADTWGVDVSGGDLVVPHPATESYFQIETSAGFDFRGRTMVLELSVPPGPGASLWWNVAGDTSNYLEFYIDPLGTLHLGYEKDDDFFGFASVQFDPVQHRFQRFREEAGTAFYDVSPDGSSWDEIGSWQLDDVFDPAFTSVYIGGYTDGVTAPDGDMHIARVYAEDPVPSAPCPTTALADDFNDGDRSSAWYKGWWSDLCPISEAFGLLRFSCQPGDDESSGYVSSSAYDLRGTSASIEIVDYPAGGSGGYMGLGVARPDEETFYQLEINDGELRVLRVIDDDWTDVMATDYDPVGARFLQIREQGGTVYFETSADGAGYDTVYSESATFAVSEVLLFAFGGSYLASAPVDLAFDNLNLGDRD